VRDNKTITFANSNKQCKISLKYINIIVNIHTCTYTNKIEIYLHIILYVLHWSTYRVTVNYNDGSMSWLVPYKSEEGYRYAFVERTLCLFDYEFEVHSQTVEVALSTASGHPIHFGVILYFVPDFAVQLGDTDYVRGVGVSTPQYRFVDLSRSDNDHLIQLKVESNDDDVCAIVSLQPFDCPASDTIETVGYHLMLLLDMDTMCLSF